MCNFRVDVGIVVVIVVVAIIVLWRALYLLYPHIRNEMEFWNIVETQHLWLIYCFINSFLLFSFCIGDLSANHNLSFLLIFLLILSSIVFISWVMIPYEQQKTTTTTTSKKQKKNYLSFFHRASVKRNFDAFVYFVRLTIYYYCGFIVLCCAIKMSIVHNIFPKYTQSGMAFRPFVRRITFTLIVLHNNIVARPQS